MPSEIGKKALKKAVTEKPAALLKECTVRIYFSYRLLRLCVYDKGQGISLNKCCCPETTKTYCRLPEGAIKPAAPTKGEPYPGGKKQDAYNQDKLVAAAEGFF